MIQDQLLYCYIQEIEKTYEVLKALFEVITITFCPGFVSLLVKMQWMYLKNQKPANFKATDINPGKLCSLKRSLSQHASKRPSKNFWKKKSVYPNVRFAYVEKI